MSELFSSYHKCRIVIDCRLINYLTRPIFNGNTITNISRNPAGGRILWTDSKGKHYFQEFTLWKKLKNFYYKP